MQKHNVKLTPSVPSIVLTLSIISSQIARSLSLILLSLTVLNGCDMNMSDQMIKDMESAYVIVGEGRGSTHEKRVEATSSAVQKYFPPGMKAEEAFKLLRQLKEQGFEVDESRHEGARNWPDGALMPYRDEETRRHLQQHYPKGVSEFMAKKQYGSNIMMLATKHVVISFRVVDGSGVISTVKGSLSASGI